MINPTPIEFMRSEAKKMWKSLPSDIRLRTTKQEVFSQLRKAWKGGDRVKREDRGTGIFKAKENQGEQGEG